MVSAVEIRFLQLPGWAALRWCVAALSALSAALLYAHGALWPAWVALVLAPLELIWSPVNSILAVCLRDEGRCEVATSSGRYEAAVEAVFQTSGLTVLRLRGHVTAHTVLLLPGNLPPVLQSQFGRWLKSAFQV